MEQHKVKRPPININAMNNMDGNGGDKIPSERGNLSYVDDKGGGGRDQRSSEVKPKMNLTQIFITVAAAVLVSLGLGIMMFTTGATVDTKLAGLETNQGQVSENTGRIDNVINSQANFITKNNLDDYATKNSLPNPDSYALKTDLVGTDLSGYYTKGEVDAAIILILEEKEAIEEEEEEATTWGEVRWRFRNVEISYKTLTAAMVTYKGTEVPEPAPDLGYISNNIYAELDDIDPRTIEDEDIYDIELIVLNSNQDWEVDLRDVVFTLILNPDDYALLDEDMTYLDSDSSPYLDWDASFEVRERENQDVTRRVEFESSKLSNLRVYEDDYSDTMDLVLELYYN